MPEEQDVELWSLENDDHVSDDGAESHQFGAMLEGALDGLDAAGAEELRDPQRADPDRKECARSRLQKVGDIIAEGKVLSFDTISSRLGCDPHWIAVRKPDNFQHTGERHL